MTELMRGLLHVSVLVQLYLHYALYIRVCAPVDFHITACVCSALEHV